MSLINKMLQDLDARGNPRDGAVPPAVKPVALASRRLPPGRIAAITAALLVLALGVAAWVVLPLKGKTFDAQPAAVPAPLAAVAPVAPLAPPAAAPQPQPEPEPVTVAEVANPPARAEGLQREKEVPAATRQAAAPARAAVAAAADPGPTEEQLASTTTTWAVASERARAEQLRLAARWRAEEARIAALPRGERAAALERLRAQQARAAVRTQADAAFVAALKRKEEAAGAPAAPLAAAGPAAAAARPAGPKGQGRVDNPAQGAENSYRRALAALQDGRVAEAIAGLQATLRAQPSHEAARQTLVSLLIENNRSDEAVLQLQQALGLDARQPALAMLLARLQIERGGSGIDTLLRTLPYATGNGDYHAFLAGALARQSRHGEAVEQYQAALRSVPGNAVWWMGLGMSLQADRRNAEALDAFRQARSLGSLSAELQAFVERKLQQLAR